MRRVRFEASVDPRRHYLVSLTQENLARVPLELPIFLVVDGRPAGVISSRSADGLRVLANGENVLYVGIVNMFGIQVRNVGLGAVLRGIHSSLSTAADPDGLLRLSGTPPAASRLRAALEMHLLALDEAAAEHIEKPARAGAA